MSEAGGVFCAGAAALERADTYPAGEAGQVLRSVRDLKYAETLAAIRRHLA